MLQDFKAHFITIFLFHAVLLWGSFTVINSQKSISSKKNSQETSEIHIKLAQMSQPNRSLKKISPLKKTLKPSPVIPKAFIEEKVLNEVSSAMKSMTEAEIETQRSLFKKELRAEIEKNKFYPSLSRRLGQSGVVEVAFTLLEDGHIINVRLNRSSPFEKLNQSALEAVRKVHLFRPIPKEWGEGKMDLLVSLKFMRI